MRLVSYSLHGFYGASGTGKTTMMNTLAKAHVNQAAKSTYDFNKPFENNGDITYDFYLAPSIKSDMTMASSLIKNRKTIFVEVNDERMSKLSTLIRCMESDVSDALRYQLSLKTATKENVTKIIDRIENVKRTYPELRLQNPDEELVKIYESVGQVYDGFSLRRQKIMIRFDDY